MNRITLTWGKPPVRNAKSLEGSTVGYLFDDPKEGLMKVFANTERCEETVIILSEDLIDVDIEIIKEKTR